VRRVRVNADGPTGSNRAKHRGATSLGRIGQERSYGGAKNRTAEEATIVKRKCLVSSSAGNARDQLKGETGAHLARLLLG